MGIPLFPILSHVSTKIPTSLPTRPSRFGTRSRFRPQLCLGRSCQLPRIGPRSENPIEARGKGKHEHGSMGSHPRTVGAVDWHVLVVGAIDLWFPVS